MASTLFTQQATARAFSTLEGDASPDAFQADKLSPADQFAEERLALLAMALSRSAAPSMAVLVGAQERLFGAVVVPPLRMEMAPVPANPPTASRVWIWGGWAAALVLGCLWLLRETQSIRTTLHSENVPPKSTTTHPTVEGGTGLADPTEAEIDPDAPSEVPGKLKPDGKRELKNRGIVIKPSGTLETITVLRQDFEKLKQDLGALKEAHATTLVPDPKVARPTIIELSDPARPAGADKDKVPLTERIGEKLNRDLENDTGKEPEAGPAPEQEEPPVKPRATYFDRNAPSQGTFQVPGGVVEIGGGYFYDPSRNVIMEPTGDGQTFELRTPGPDFDPDHPRLMPVVDLSQSLAEPTPPAPKPTPTAPLKPTPSPTASNEPPPYIDNGYAWVDQTSGQGALILPPGVPSPAEGQSYWLWMTVPGRETPVAVGRVEDLPSTGGSVEFTLPQTGLLPGSFLLTQEGLTTPAIPSQIIILKGP